MSVGLGIHWRFRVLGNVDLFDHGDRIAGALADLEKATPGLLDSAISVDRGQRTVEIEVSVDADTENDALDLGQSSVRAAIHAAGGGTPNWPAEGNAVELLPTELETSRLATA